jgi:hypothetical protein
MSRDRIFVLYLYSCLPSYRRLYFDLRRCFPKHDGIPINKLFHFRNWILSVYREGDRFYWQAFLKYDGGWESAFDFNESKTHENY